MRTRNVIPTISLMLLSSLAAAQSATPDAPAEPESPQTEINQSGTPTEPAEAPPPPTPPAPPAPTRVPSAQSQGDQGTAGGKVERIQVTGSRIKQIDVEKASPVTVYSKEEIDRSGAATVTDFIRNRIVSATVTSENATLTQAGGEANFQGRDFGSSYTLVLVNGRRIPTSAIVGDSVDLNLIPLAAVERVEYLTDGASAIYGSDAVAGVLNIITKKDFQGTAVLFRGGIASDHWDGAETGVQITSGATGDRTNFLVTADIFKRESIGSKDRPLINNDIAPSGNQDGRSVYGYPGTVQVFTPGVGVDRRAFTNCDPALVDAATGFCLYPVAKDYAVGPKTERQSIFTSFDHQLFDKVKVFGEGRFSRTETLVQNGPSPGALVFTGAEYNALPLAVRQLSPLYDAANPGAVLPDDASVAIYRRFVEFGKRIQNNINESFNLVGGLSGEIGEDINWEFSLAKHRMKNLQYGVNGNLNRDKVVGYFQDGTLNPFLLNEFSTPAQLTAREDAVEETFRLGQADLEVYNLTFDGTVPALLPGGDIGWAAGVEYRDEKFSDNSDSASQDDAIIGSAGGKGAGGQENHALFVETNPPVMTRLDLNLAYRHDNLQNTIGAKNVKQADTYHAGLAYRPIDSVKFRTSYSTGFKAAPLYIRYLQESFGASPTEVVDVAGCAAGATSCDPQQVNSRSVGNTDLSPEKSEYVNGGFVIQPLQDMSFTIDYWHLKVKDVIGQLDVQYLLNNEAAYPDFITRSPAGNLTDDGSYVTTQYLNLTKAESAGLELGGSYLQNLGFARLNSTLKVAKTIKSRSQDQPNDPMCDVAKYTNSPNYLLSAELLTGVWSAGATTRYNSGYTSHQGGRISGTCTWADPSTAYHVKSYMDLDLFAGYVAPWGTEFGVGINNVTNAQPAIDENEGWPWYDQAAYSNIGRFLYATVGHKFD